MVKRKTVSMSRSRGTVHRHQAYQARCAKILAQRQTHLGPHAKKSPSTPSTAIFRPFFPRWANFFAPRAQGRHNCETNGITQRPPRYNTLPTTTVAHPWRYETLPAREKTAVLAQNASAGRILYRSQSIEAEQGELCTGHRELTPPPPITSQSTTPPVGHGVEPTWLTMRIGYDDADRLISYPDAHNLSR